MLRFQIFVVELPGRLRNQTKHTILRYLSTSNLLNLCHYLCDDTVEVTLEAEWRLRFRRLRQSNRNMSLGLAKPSVHGRGSLAAAVDRTDDQ